MTKKAKLTEQLREAIRNADRSVYQIAEETGIDKSTLSRFLADAGGLSMAGLDRLGECLGLSVQQQANKKTAKPKK